MKKIIVVIIALAAVLSACQQEETVDATPPIITAVSVSKDTLQLPVVS